MELSMGPGNALVISALLVPLIVVEHLLLWGALLEGSQSGFVKTQRRRYGWTLAGQLVILFAMLWPVVQFGLAESLRTLAAFERATGPIGWAAYLIFVVGLVSPASTVLLVWAWYDAPASMAKKKRGGFVSTADVRAKVPNPPRWRSVDDIHPVYGWVRDRRWVRVL
jgi:hypothetical protein